MTRTRTKSRKPEPVFGYLDGVLSAGRFALPGLARDFGTPAYIYLEDSLVAHYREYDRAFGNRPHLVCYAVKANPARSVLAPLAAAGAGFDIVSAGELAQVLAAGGQPGRIVFSGVGKRDDEIEAALDAKIRCFNVESAAELRQVDRLARRRNCVAPVALRVNPDITAQTHRHIATGGDNHKFGIPQGQVPGLATAATAMHGISLDGLAMHIGSQITDLGPLIAAAGRLRQLAADLATIATIRHIDLGGGLGIGPRAPDRTTYVNALCEVFADTGFELAIEPGRSIVGPAGVLLTRVTRIKHGYGRSFAICDAGMNDLLRPALYDAYHQILVVDQTNRAPSATYEVAGPVCETGDTLGSRRRLAIREGSLLAIMDAGAYGATMSSHYNSRPRCCEITVDGEGARLTRQRETVAELGRNEVFMNLESHGQEKS